MTTSATNKAENSGKKKATGRPFTKDNKATGEKDARINRRGRLVSDMTALKREYQKIWAEIMLDENGKPIKDADGELLTRLRARLRVSTSSRNTQEFQTALAYAFGKPKEEIEENHKGEIILRVVREETKKTNDNA